MSDSIPKETGRRNRINHGKDLSTADGGHQRLRIACRVSAERAIENGSRGKRSKAAS